MEGKFKIWFSLLFVLIILSTLIFLFIKREPGVKEEESTEVRSYVYNYCMVYEKSECGLFFDEPEIEICEQSLMLIDAVLNKNIEKCDIYSNPLQCKMLINLDKTFCTENAKTEEDLNSCKLVGFVKSPEKIKDVGKENWASLYFWAALINKDISLCSKIPKTDLFSMKSEGVCKTLLTRNSTYCVDYYRFM